MNPKLEAIARQAAEHLAASIVDGEKDILSAWDDCTDEAQSNETQPKLKLGFAITLDLDGNKAEYALSWGVRRRIVSAAEIPDPDQQTLPIGDEEPTVEMRLPDGTTTGPVPTARMKAATEALKRRAGGAE